MSLEYWQTRLHNQFAALAKERSANGHPVFALEHGLDATERQSLAADIRASLTVRAPSDAYWLSWVVYATEVGYTYDGEEYWQTFEETTPRWATCRSRPRDWLRDRFVRFQKSYHGLKPSGRWASWFSIIAWPIQHAILPVYLQYHLAKLVYELRYDLTPELLKDPIGLGQYLHAESTRSVRRLQEFAEEHALIGTIATALLLSGNELKNISILPQTLQRLIADLEREQRARDWLRVAQEQARRVSLRGVSVQGTPAVKAPSTTSSITKAEVPELEPGISVVPEANDEWSVYLETPDMATLTTRFPRFRSVLATSRCSIGVGAGRWQAPGWLLYGPHRVPLPAWPKPGEVLLRLEKGDAVLDALFRADFLLRPGTTWLFKIGTDGIGYEIRNLAVRPGQRYLIAKTTGTLPIERPASAVNIRCAGKSGDTAGFIQNPEVQEQPLRDLIAQRGWQFHQLYSDRASGAKEKRPGLNALMADARRGLFDVVVVWRFDRFARSVRQLVLALEEFRALGIEFVSHQEALDISTPIGRAMFTIIAAIAELERNIIQERVVAGLDHARRRGTRSGQPVGRPRVIIDVERVIGFRRDGVSWSVIARRMKSTSGTVRRAYKDALKRKQSCENPVAEAV